MGKALKKTVIVVHGGAGAWPPERRKPGLAGVKEAAIVGFDILGVDGNALDAVEAELFAWKTTRFSMLERAQP